SGCAAASRWGVAGCGCECVSATTAIRSQPSSRTRSAAVLTSWPMRWSYLVLRAASVIRRTVRDPVAEQLDLRRRQHPADLPHPAPGKARTGAGELEHEHAGVGLPGLHARVLHAPRLA